MKKQTTKKQITERIEQYFLFSRQELFPSPIHLFSTDTKESPEWLELQTDSLAEVRTNHGTWGIYQDYFFSYSPNYDDGTVKVSIKKSNGLTVSCWGIATPSCYILGYVQQPDDTMTPGLIHVSALCRFLLFDDADTQWLLDQFQKLGDPPLYTGVYSAANEEYKSKHEKIVEKLREKKLGMVYGQWLPGTEEIMAPENRWRFPYKTVHHTLSWKK